MPVRPGATDELPAAHQHDELKRMVWERGVAATREAIARASLDTLVAIAAAGSDAHYVLTLLARDVPPAPPERLIADRKALARATEFRARLSEQAGGTLDPRSTALLLGVSRATVAAKRRRRQILGVPFARETRYPYAQFEHGKPLPGLDKLLASFGDMKPWVQLQMLLTPLEGFAPEPTSMIELLRRGVTDQELGKLCGLALSWNS